MSLFKNFWSALALSLAICSGYAGEIVLSNGAIAIAFSQESYGVRSITGEGERFVFARDENPPLFSIEFQAPKEDKSYFVTNLDPSSRSFEIKNGKDGAKSAIFSFKNFRLDGEDNAFDVTVTVTLAKDAPRAEWFLAVTNRSSKLVEWGVVFPMLQSVTEPGTGDLLFPVGNFGGKVFKNSKVSKSVRYPSFTGYTQFMGYTKNGKSLYLACHDTEGWTKDFSVNPNQDVRIRTHVQNGAKLGKARTASFPFVTEIVSGDWLAMAKNYRRWAEKNAPWLGKGKLADRKDFNHDILTPGPWLCIGWMSVAEIVDTMARAKKNFGMPAALHWYVWHVSDFDYDYPELKPKPGFREGVQTMSEAGHLIMPYTNGHVWDNNLASFAAMKPYGAMKKDGSLYEETWGTPPHSFTGMCPATGAYQDFLSNYSAEFINDNQLPALYLDQIAAVEPNWCFNEAHGHETGAGSYWMDGYRKLLSDIQAKSDHRAALTSECAQEMFIDTIVGYLTWLAIESEDVPLLPAIYSDYATYIGSPSNEKDSFEAFVAIKLRSFLWGVQPGWDQVWITNDSAREKARYVAALAEKRKQYASYLAYGEYLGVVASNNPIKECKSTQNYVMNSTVRQLSTPAVMSALWRGRDGNLAVMLGNSTDEPILFNGSLAIPDGSYWVKSDGVPDGLVKGTRWDILQKLQPFEVKVLELATTPTPEVMEGGAIFLLQRFLAAFEVGLKPLPELFSAFEGAMQTPAFELKNDGKTVRTLQISFAGNPPLSITLQPGESRRVEESFSYRGKFELTVAVDGRRQAVLIEPLKLPLAAVDCEEQFRAVNGADLVIPVLIRNNTGKELTAECKLTLNSKYQVAPGRTMMVKIPPFGQVEAQYKVSPPQLAAAKNESGRIAVKIDGVAFLDRRIKIQFPKFSPSAVAHRLATPPKIDGNLDEWSKFAPMKIDAEQKNNIKMADYRGNQDLSLQFRVGYDSKYFYFAAEVEDDVHHQKNDGGNLWRGDGFQISFLDGLNSSGGATGNEVDFGLALTDYGAELYDYSRKHTSEGGLVEVVRTGTKTLYEAAILWSEIGFDPAGGKPLSWSFVLSDNDGTPSMRGYFEWTPGIFGTKDSSEYQVLQLEK